MENSESLFAGGFVIVVLLVSALFGLIYVIAGWKLMAKAGRPGWISLVPGYNMWVWGQIVYGDDKAWKIFLCLIPYVGFIPAMILLYRYGQIFGRGPVFCVCNIFFNFVTMPFLAFNSDTYQGPIEDCVL